MHQRWEELTFLHWPYEPSAIRHLLPDTVELETYDGAAWIGLVPFRITHLRPPLIPSIPWISHFPETNVRTYVRGPSGKRGVWFFSLDADRLLAVMAARASFRLPYRWARMRVESQAESVSYESHRHLGFGKGGAHILVRPGARMRAGNFDNFLTAQFCLYTAAAGKLLMADIEHAPWPLQSAAVLQLEEDLIQNSGVPKPHGDPVVHFSKRLDVRIGMIRSASTKPD